ncbi:hypothetical protein EDD85DRAFT_941154 [Armillaria nabsnona]|nr:hypothetical protein EDD85DRAFT_941154 [Armillaria nabsnona]
MKHPHRNVAEYYGYVENDGLMAGICFKRYGQTLRDAAEKGTLKAGDIEFTLEQIEKGIQQIHGLGLVHKEASIDFNGESFPRSNNGRIAEFENDDLGLNKITEWMKKTLVEEIPFEDSYSLHHAGRDK